MGSEPTFNGDARKFTRARNRTGVITYLIGTGTTRATSGGGFAPVASRVEALASWYLSRQDVPPVRLVMRTLSEDGTNEWTSEFRRWLTNERATRDEVMEEPCDHPSRAHSTVCHWCAVFDEAGNALVETGKRTYTRRLYVYPMRAAVARINRARVPDGFPSLGVTLMALAGSGSLARALVVLQADYPALEGELAFRHLRLALERVHAAYAPGPFPRTSRASRTGKSDSQADAEAAPRD